jgi:hypothetical protein
VRRKSKSRENRFVEERGSRIVRRSLFGLLPSLVGRPRLVQKRWRALVASKNGRGRESWAWEKVEGGSSAAVRRTRTSLTAVGTRDDGDGARERRAKVKGEKGDQPSKQTLSPTKPAPTLRLVSPLSLSLVAFWRCETGRHPLDRHQEPFFSSSSTIAGLRLNHDENCRKRRRC